MAIKTGFITVDYDGSDPLTYKGIKATLTAVSSGTFLKPGQKTEERKTFSELGFDGDREAAVHWLLSEGSISVMGSSTIDHFVMDRVAEKVVLLAPESEPMHGWFGLSRASYLVLQRSLIEGMPDEWQQRLVNLLKEFDDVYDTSQIIGTFLVNARDGRRFVADPYRDYRHPAPLPYKERSEK